MRPAKTLPEKMVTVALRYDDYSALSPDFLDLELISSLREFRAPCTFAVIPSHCTDSKNPAAAEFSALTPGKAAQLRAAVSEGIIEIALHGHTHQSHRAKNFSEFAGLDPGLQREKIATGTRMLRLLFDVPVTTFVPPWNTYDRQTLKLLAQAGFKCISAFPNKPFLADSPLSYVPATCLLGNLRRAIEHARERGGAHPLVMAYFHPYEFREADPERGTLTLQEFRTELEWLQAQADVEVKTIGEIAKGAAYDAATYARFARPMRLVPEFISRNYLNDWGSYPRHARAGTPLLAGLLSLLSRG